MTDNHEIVIDHPTDAILAEVNAALATLTVERNLLQPATRATVQSLIVHLEAERTVLERAIARMKAAIASAP